MSEQDIKAYDTKLIRCFAWIIWIAAMEIRSNPLTPTDLLISRADSYIEALDERLKRGRL